MKFFGYMGLDQEGHLRIANVDLDGLKNEYGTPLYIIDEMGLVENMNSFSQAFSSDKFEGRLIYASRPLPIYI